MNKIKQKGTALSALLMAMLLVSMAFVPAVNAATVTELAPANDVGQVVKIDSPKKIEVKENTKTSQIVQVGDVLISLKSNPQHTEAVLDVEDLKTKEKKTITYKISKESGNFTTEIYYEGKLANTFVTDYDPLEPGVTADVLKNNAKKTETAGQVTTLAYNYWWDSVYFTKGSGIKYPHPDYQYYGAEAWENFYISGNQLYHNHIDEYTSASIAQLAPVAAGAAIGAYVGGVVGAIAGAVLGLILGNASSSIILDERNSIWYWDSQVWGWTIIPVPPYLQYLPKYFRIAAYTLWDGLGIGNP